MNMDSDSEDDYVDPTTPPDINNNCTQNEIFQPLITNILYAQNKNDSETCKCCLNGCKNLTVMLERAIKIIKEDVAKQMQSWKEQYDSKQRAEYDKKQEDFMLRICELHQVPKESATVNNKSTPVYNVSSSSTVANSASIVDSKPKKRKRYPSMKQKMLAEAIKSVMSEAGVPLTSEQIANLVSEKTSVKIQGNGARRVQGFLTQLSIRNSPLVEGIQRLDYTSSRVLQYVISDKKNVMNESNGQSNILVHDIFYDDDSIDFNS
ncbi:greA [Acrasis kona]|uniref:GreA n=1 Tax=Acrasis kona TaxID=1008807 RepID=A0AAW2ZRK8_9EUKA